jgi:hypothetical protein
MDYPYHPMPLEKDFLKVVFLLKYHQNPPALKETEHRKKREKVLKKREREKERKRKREKEKLQESLQIKRGSQYFERRKTLQLQNPFCMSPFSFPPSYHFKNSYQNHLIKFCSTFWTIF